MFDGLRFPKLTPRYNIAPTQDVLCVRPSREDSQLEAVTLRWGLVPFWAKELKIGARMINARAETVATKPAFRAAFKKRRCVVLADGFFEWKREGKSKLPFYMTRPDDKPFPMAGLWESWRDKSVEESPTIETCTIITTSANEMMESLHDRMPVILDDDGMKFWLDKEFAEPEPLERILVPCPPETLVATAVNPIVNKVANDSPECIKAI